MMKFSKDKQNLLKTLSKLDNSVTVSDVTDSQTYCSQSEDTKISTLVVHVALEALSATYERDEEKRRKLFNGVVDFLMQSKLLDDQINLFNLLPTRRKMASKLLKIFAEVHNTIEPNPTNDLRYLDFKQTGPLQHQTYNGMFEEIKVIAAGGFGTVCMAKSTVDGLVYAVKKIVFKYRRDSDYRKVIREARSFATLNHINIVRYNSAWLEEEDSTPTDSSSSSDALSEFGDSSNYSTSRSLNKWDVSMESNSSRSNNVIRSKFFQSSSSTSSSSSSDVSQESNRKSDDSSVTKVNNPLLNFMCPKLTLCIQMEYCDCDLRYWLDQRARGKSLPFKMSEPCIFRDILNGVSHIHLKSIIHRDLKPQNIFFSAKEGVMKIGDFGLATLEESSPKKQQGKISTQLSSDLGTLPYAAPEQRNKNHYNSKVDIYSLGIILIELLLQFGTRMEFCRTIEDIARGNVPAELISQWPNYVFLVENLIHKDPNNRLSANDILNLPVIRGNNNTKQGMNEGLIERLEQEVVKQRHHIEEQALIITQLRKQIEELSRS